MADEGTGSAQQQPLSVRGSKWERAQLEAVGNYLSMVAQFLGAQKAAECAEVLKVIRDGSAPGLQNCPTIGSSIASRYPVFCVECAPRIGAVSPQKMLFCVERTPSEIVWVAAFYGVGFVLANIGRPNTQEAAEALLDELTNEESVAQLQALCDLNTNADGRKLLAN